MSGLLASLVMVAHRPCCVRPAVLAGQLGVDTSMATTGIVLDMDRAHDLLKNMSWIRFNLSAGTSVGFKRVHQSKEKT